MLLSLCANYIEVLNRPLIASISLLVFVSFSCAKMDSTEAARKYLALLKHTDLLTKTLLNGGNAESNKGFLDYSKENLR